MKNDPGSATSGDRDGAESIADRYAALRLELTRLYSEPVPDLVAIDATMKEIDAMHRHFKEITAQRDDPQRF